MAISVFFTSLIKLSYFCINDYYCGHIRELFDIQKGSYEEGTGMVELEAPSGQPQTFVIGGGGNTRNLYHALQRKGMPFITGILYDNDMDYPTARTLAAEVLICRPFIRYQKN
mgnify:CR=1 FL=1